MINSFPKSFFTFPNYEMRMPRGMRKEVYDNMEEYKIDKCTDLIRYAYMKLKSNEINESNIETNWWALSDQYGKEFKTDR